MTKQEAIAQWKRGHRGEGRVVGTFESVEGQPMTALATLEGTIAVPSARLMDVDEAYIVKALSLRFFDVIDAAQRTGYTPKQIHAALQLASKDIDKA